MLQGIIFDIEFAHANVYFFYKGGWVDSGGSYFFSRDDYLDPGMTAVGQVDYNPLHGENIPYDEIRIYLDGYY